MVDDDTDSDDSAGEDARLSTAPATPAKALVDNGIQPDTDGSLSTNNASPGSDGEVDQGIAKLRSAYAGIDSSTQGGHRC